MLSLHLTTQHHNRPTKPQDALAERGDDRDGIAAFAAFPDADAAVGDADQEFFDALAAYDADPALVALLAGQPLDVPDANGALLDLHPALPDASGAVADANGPGPDANGVQAPYAAFLHAVAGWVRDAASHVLPVKPHEVILSPAFAAAVENAFQQEFRISEAARTDGTNLNVVTADTLESLAEDIKQNPIGPMRNNVCVARRVFNPVLTSINEHHQDTPLAFGGATRVRLNDPDIAFHGVFGTRFIVDGETAGLMVVKRSGTETKFERAVYESILYATGLLHARGDLDRVPIIVTNLLHYEFLCIMRDRYERSERFRVEFGSDGFPVNDAARDQLTEMQNFAVGFLRHHFFTDQPHVADEHTSINSNFIGALAAGFGYSYNYGSIFHWESAGVPHQEAHVRRKKRDAEFHEASLALFSNSHRVDGEPTSRTSASFGTAHAPPSTNKGDIAIHIQ